MSEPAETLGDFLNALNKALTPAAPEVEVAAKALGDYRRALEKEGFTPDQAFDIIFELLKQSKTT